MTDYLSNRHQRGVLNGTQSQWLPHKSGVPQGSVLGPLLFLVYINDLTDNISSTMKLFVDDASLFLRVRDVHMFPQTIRSDLGKITDWAHQWKMRFNPDVSKQAVESFSRRSGADLNILLCHLIMFLSSVIAKQSTWVSY